jgi:ribosomal protein L37AE/L43A
MPKEKDEFILPDWAPRLPPGKIKRLYELDARGIYDEEFLDEVGWALKARCESFLHANRAVSGEAICPVCDQLVAHQHGKDEMLICQSCGWQASWKAYFKTIQHKQLSGAEPVLNLFSEFIEKFPKARSPQEKMFLIDRLLHGFHYYGKTPTRPVAINLIEGRLSEVMDFLDELSYGNQSTPGTREQYGEWFEKSQNARHWGKPKS